MSEFKNLNVTVSDNGTATAMVTGLRNDKQYEIRIVAKKNENSASAPSNALDVTPHPTPTPPKPTLQVFIGGKDFEDEQYCYSLFPSGFTTGFEVLRTEEGANVECEVLLVGAGGAGKGQTMTLGKGGDGGGGQLVLGTLPAPGYAGSVFVTVPNGASTSDNPANTSIKEGSFTIVANAGKSATDKNDATGYPSQEVPMSWQSLSEFKWMEPGSHFVGGVASSGEQNYPDGTYDGQGGAGTKTNKAGKGGDSFVAIRWKK